MNSRQWTVESSAQPRRFHLPSLPSAALAISLTHRHVRQPTLRFSPQANPTAPLISGFDHDADDG